MSDEDDDKDIEDVELDDFEWDDALADWEDEVEDSAEAASAPMPQRPAASAAARPLYRPPSPGETFERRPPPRPRPPVPQPDLDDPFGDDHPPESTRIASIPQELINSLVANERHERPTGPPPAQETRGAPPPVDLDLDGLLDGLSETRNRGPVVAPKKPKERSPSAETPLDRLSEPPDSGIFDPFSRADAEGDLVASFPPPRPDADAHRDDLAAMVPDEDDLAGDELETVAANVPSVPRPTAPRLPPPGIPKPPGAALRGGPSVPRPPIPRPGSIPKPPPPTPGAKLPVPRPGAPVVPRPPLGGPRPPAPGAAARPIARPMPGALPKPGGVPKPGGLPRPGGLPTPGGSTTPGASTPPDAPRPVSSAPAAPEPPRSSERPLPDDRPTPIPSPPAARRPAAPTDAETTVDVSPLAAPPPEDPLADLGLDPRASELDAGLDDFLDASLAGAPPDEAHEPEEIQAAGARPSSSAAPPPPPPLKPISFDEDDDDDVLLAVDEAPAAADEDDDEPAFEVGEDDGDEAEPAFELGEDDEDYADQDEEVHVGAEDDATEGDDDDLVIAAGDEGDEDWDDEDWEEVARAEEEAAEAARAEADRGALAARRSVRSRKPRDESFPMIGDGGEALRLRRRLLATLARDREGSVRARLLVSAAELAEQLGDVDEARSLYRDAIAADGTDVVALRALRRLAVSAGAWAEIAVLYQREAALDLSPWEKTFALTGLAEVLLARLDDPARAAAAAEEALSIQPASVASALLLAEARWRLGSPEQAVAGFAGVREIWDDPDGRAALALEEARVRERRGDAEGARELYRWAAEVDPEALDAWMGRARTSSRAGGDPGGAIEALAALAAYSPGALGEAVLTRASRVAARVGGDPGLGVRLLAEATGVLPLQARADAAAALGDPALEMRTLEAWASAAGGTDRALALVRLAEVRAREQDLDGAEAALRDAALADGSLGTIRVVREVIARRSGDLSRLAEVGEGGALAAAARVARDPESLPRERELLEQASAEGEALVTVDVLSFDVIAGLGDDDALDTALRRQADRVPPEQRAGSLLTLTERAIDRDELDRAEALLAEARHLSPGDPLVLRPLGRLVSRRDPTQSAALWLEESSTSEGDRAAFAAAQAGRVLTMVQGDALGAYRRALDAVPGYGPAAWALKPLATEMGDPLTLGEVHEQLADAAASPLDAAAHLVRGALLRADADPESAGALLERARAGNPDDTILRSLVMRLSGAAAPAARAEMLAASADATEGALARVFRLNAAAAFEDAGDAGRSASEYRKVAATDEDDPFVSVAVDRVEIAAGEVARVASRRFNAVKAAKSDEERVLALERLAELDAGERADPASAVLSWQSILEIAPGHLSSLRALSRYFLEQGRLDDAARVVGALAEHVQEGPDVTAHLRLARRLAFVDPEAPGESADALLVAAGARAELDLWLAPRVWAAAEAQGDGALAQRATMALAELLGSPEEVASMRVRVAELEDDPGAAIEQLELAVAACETHPVAAEALAEAAFAAGDWERAASAFMQAAKASDVRRRAAELFHRAGVLYQEKLADPTRARAALEPASEADVTYADVFARLEGLLEEAGDREALSALYAVRLAVGGDTATLVDLYSRQADLRRQASDLEGSKNALRAALALQPERIEALRDLADLCIEDEDWRGAAEVLIRIARIRKEREELRWVFFTLGDIYDQHMPDPRRAEAAFNRVLKLLPQDVPAMERLARLYERESQLEKAAEMRQQLARLDVDPDANRAHRIQLSTLYEQLGDARKAEQVLDEARRNGPTDLTVLRTLADFYQRQDASNALAMHLRRAVSDFRQALEADLGDAAAWPGLVEVLSWSDARDAAAAAASAAQAIGIMDVEMSKQLDARGGAPAAGAGAALESLDELLAPDPLGAPTRAVFRLAGDALEKSLPFELAAYHAEKVNARDTSVRPLAVEIGRWFGVPDPQLYVTSAAPRVCVPVYSNPVTLLIGSELLGITDDREKAFVLVRAFKIAKAQLSVVVRAQPHEVLALLAGLVQSYDPHHAPAGVDPAHVAEAARRVAKNVNKKARDELGPLVFEMAGRPGYDPSSLAMSASEWGNRTALIATGSAPAAVSALAKLSGERELPTDPSSRLAMLQRFPEAAALLAFAISDAHFEARRRAGTEGGR